jgi:hypothetical protein
MKKEQPQFSQPFREGMDGTLRETLDIG